jgi:hypothetical protein
MGEETGAAPVGIRRCWSLPLQRFSPVLLLQLRALLFTQSKLSFSATAMKPAHFTHELILFQTYEADFRAGNT